jgi:hypothetical protein
MSLHKAGGMKQIVGGLISHFSSPYLQLAADGKWRRDRGLENPRFAQSVQVKFSELDAVLGAEL